jgi:hypothetical protein
MKRHFQAESYNLYEQSYPSIKDTFLHFIRKFWRFSLFYESLSAVHWRLKKKKSKGNLFFASPFLVSLFTSLIHK